jgi:hypothetical protein
MISPSAREHSFADSAPALSDDEIRARLIRNRYIEGVSEYGASTLRTKLDVHVLTLDFFLLRNSSNDLAGTQRRIHLKT